MMKNPAAANLVFSKDGGIQRNLIPIGKCVTAFEAKAPDLCFTGVMLDIGFHGDIEAIRKAVLGLDRKIVVGLSEMNNRVFVD